jgi:ribonuclease Z
MSHVKSSLVATVALLFCLMAHDVRGQEIVVTLLGTGSPLPEIDRFGPSILVQAGRQTLLFDVGRGAHQRLAQAGVPADQIDAVFLTHLHSDHVVGIPDLWLTGWLVSRRNRPWEVFGPTGTLPMMNALKVAFSADINARIEETGGIVPPAAGAEVNTHEIRSGVVYERDGLRVTAIQVEHRAIAPAYGYRIDYSGRSVVLSGDTSLSRNLIEAAAGTQLFVHEIDEVSEAILKDNPVLTRVKTFHVDASEAGSVFQRVRPKLAVYSHIILLGVSIDDVVKRTRATYGGPLVVGEDLMRFVVGQDVAVYRR